MGPWRPWPALVTISPFFFWGSAMVAMKGVLPLTAPFFLAGMRILPAGLAILLVAHWQGRSHPQGWRGWLWVAAFALVDGTLFQGFLAWGLTRTGAGFGSVLIDSQPLAVALLSRWLFQDVIGVWGWCGLALGAVGITCLGLPDISPMDLAGAWIHGAIVPGQLVARFLESGTWLMLLAALSMALGTVSIRFVARHCDVVTASGWHLILGGVPLLLLSGLREVEPWQHIDVSGWIALAYATVFGSAVAYGVFFYIASTRDLTSFSSLTFLTPVFALLLGYVTLGETLTPRQWTGTAIALASVYLINQRQALPAPSSRAEPGPISAPSGPNLDRADDGARP